MSPRKALSRTFLQKAARVLHKMWKTLIYVFLSLLGIFTGGLIYGVFDFLAFPESMRAGKKPEPTGDWAPGRAEIMPSQINAGDKPQTVILRFIAGRGGISEGGGIKLAPCRIIDFPGGKRRAHYVLAYGWGTLQNTRPQRPNYFTCEARSQNPVQLEVQRKPAFPLRFFLRVAGYYFLRWRGTRLPPLDLPNLMLEETKIKAKIKGARLDEGEEIIFTLGDSSKGSKGWSVPAHPILTEIMLEVDERALGRYRMIKEIPTIKVTGGEAHRLEFHVASPLESTQKVKAQVRALDSQGETDIAFSGELEVFSQEGGEAIASTILSPEDQGRKVLLLNGDEMNLESSSICYLRIRTRQPSRTLSGKSSPFKAAREDQPRLFWGDIHIHSALCDGTVNPRHAYERARDEEGLDFASLTTHDSLGKFEPTGRTREEIELHRQLVEEFTKEGEFVALLGYEWSHPAWGHRNIYYAPDEKDPVFPEYLASTSDTPEKLEKELGERKFMIVPHHTAWRKISYLPLNWGKFVRIKIPQGFNWGGRSERLRLVEIYSSHGSSERFHGPYPITHGERDFLWPSYLWDDRGIPGTGSYIDEALAWGYRFGFTGGGDRHDQAVDERKYPIRIYPHGLVGVWAEALHPISLWDALYSRHTYATTGARIFLQFQVNGLCMGEEGPLTQDPEIYFQVGGTAPLRTVELIKYDLRGYTAKIVLQEGDFPGDGWTVEHHLADQDVIDSTFYYLRVSQEDGEWAWSSPIWLDIPKR